MGFLVNCTNCKTQLQMPQGAAAIRCAHCHTVNRRCNPAPQPSYNPCYTAPSHPVGSCGGRKKAVICGINYINSDGELTGCINDAKNMRQLLINRFKFSESNIMFLTDEQRDPNRKPTKRNIMKALHWLVAGVRAGDSLVFHFAGHGGQESNDDDSDEVDGYQENISPVDFEINGNIEDDEINETIVRPIPPGAKLTAIIDACHSGTVLDLPYLCSMNRKGWYDWEDHRPLTGVWKGTRGGEAICFSGCDDHQLSHENPATSKMSPTGKMTYSFIQAIEKGHASTYGNLLAAMRAAIRKASKRDLDENLDFDGERTPYSIQEPQLSANMRFDIHTKPFSLRKY